MNFHSRIQTEFHTKIQILRIENGTEYFNHSLSTYLQENGIIHQSSCVDTPQQNGVAERKNRHILEVARALLFTSHMSSQFWGDWQPHILLTECLVGSYLLSHPSINSKSFFLILDLMHIFHFVSLGLPCLSTLTDLSGTNLIPEYLNVSFLATLPQKGVTNAMTQFHRSYMLA